MGSTTLSPSSSSTTSVNAIGKGHLTQLPPDYLRIPGTVKDQVDDDAALARMLQDDDDIRCKHKSGNKTTSRQRRSFTPLEKEAIMHGVQKHGKGNWVNIIRDPQF